MLFAWKNIKIMFFYFLKFILDINTLKRYKNTKKNNLKQKKKSNFEEKHVETHSQTVPYPISISIEKTI
jgi:hypothetical protein